MRLLQLFTTANYSVPLTTAYYRFLQDTQLTTAYHSLLPLNRTYYSLLMLTNAYKCLLMLTNAYECLLMLTAAYYSLLPRAAH